MNFIVRALKNVRRNLTKTLLLFFTFLLIGNLVIVGLSVSNATESAKSITRKSMKAIVKTEVSYDKVYEEMSKIQDEDERNDYQKKLMELMKIPNEVVSKMIADERVKTANALTREMYYATLTTHNIPNPLTNSGNATYEEILADSSKAISSYIEPGFMVKANLYPDMIELQEGELTISQGRFYTQDEIEQCADVVLISSNLAQANSLEVGDKISFFVRDPMQTFEQSAQNYGGVVYKPEDILKEFEIIGLFEHDQIITGANQQDQYYQAYELKDNLILMPATTTACASLTAQQIDYDYYSQQYPDSYSERPTKETVLSQLGLSTMTFLLNDPKDVDAFVGDYQDQIGDYNNFVIDNSQFEAASKPLDTLNFYSNFIVWLVLINAIVIISLITALTLKTRQYEIGVLLSLGTSKIKVIAQFLFELLIVVAVAFTVSIGTGSLISKTVGNTVLSYQISTSDTEQDITYYGNFASSWEDNYQTNITTDDVISQYDASVSLFVIIEMYVLALLIVLVSIIVPSLMIMRFNPKRILMSIQ